MPDIQSATSWKVTAYVAICQVANCFRTPVSVKVLKLILLKIIINVTVLLVFQNLVITKL